MAKFDWGSYFEPTPKLFRKIGDSFLAVGSTISATTLIASLNVDDPKVQKILTIAGIGTIILAAVGKFLSNFFKDSDDVQP